VQIRALRQLHQADLSNRVVHFTLRVGKPNDEADEEIHALDARQRLGQILLERRIKAFTPFFGYGDPVVCFTEATPEGLRTLVEAARYWPWGVGFGKNLIFRRGGAPAIYVRGDMWRTFTQSDLAGSAKALLTKFWPGIEPDPDITDTALTIPSEWVHEREWRVAGTGEPRAFRFTYAEIEAIVAPSVDAWQQLRLEIGLDEALAHVEVVPIPSALVAAAAPEDLPDDEDPYHDPRIREMLGLPPEW
jgi:hypothetical protein